jgi:hypothetical protein
VHEFRVTEEGTSRLTAERDRTASGLKETFGDWTAERLERFIDDLETFTADIERMTGRPWPRAGRATPRAAPSRRPSAIRPPWSVPRPASRPSCDGDALGLVNNPVGRCT